MYSSDGVRVDHCLPSLSESEDHQVDLRGQPTYVGAQSMGISGLWDQLAAAGERISFEKLATEYWTNHNRPLTVAIDTSIWAFQVQAGQKGSNPALRTFYYRLCRLLRLNVQPIFVFDGAKKPPFKRNQRTFNFYNGQSFETVNMKALIRAFGFEYWNAPGEAEAECALLQKLGIVDLVITEDVDSVMFGASKVAREISEGKKRTHVDLFSDFESATGLDIEGLVLVAMMSGGDYLPAGVPNCGPKIATEIARAGFGTSLLQTTDYEMWREGLATALESNPDKLFSRKQRALAREIRASNFPDTQILHYYSSPVVSSEEKVSAFKPNWKKPDATALSQICRQLFDWNSRWGMCRFMRSFSPGYLVWNIIHNDPPSKLSYQLSPSLKPNRAKQTSKGLEGKTMTDYFKSTKNVGVPKQDLQASKTLLTENAMIQEMLNIHGTRKHFSTDSTEELRLSYIPSQVLPYGPLNFDLTRYDAPTVSDTLQLPSASKSPTKRPSSSPKPSSGSEADEEELFVHRESKWSPDDKDRIWIPRVYIEYGLPEKVAEWEKAQALKKSPKKAKVKGGMLPGAMDRFVSKTTAVKAFAKETATLPSTTRVNIGANVSEIEQNLPKTPRKQDNFQSENLNSLSPFRPVFQTPPKIKIPSSVRKLTAAKTTKQTAKEIDSRNSPSVSRNNVLHPPEIEEYSSRRKQSIPQTPKHRITQKNATSTSPPAYGLEMPAEIENPRRQTKAIYNSPSSSPSHPQSRSLDVPTSQNQQIPSLNRRWSISSSDSDSLPSTEDLILSLMTPKTAKAKEPRITRAVRQVTPIRASTSDLTRLGGFEESPGGTMHEL